MSLYFFRKDYFIIFGLGQNFVRKKMYFLPKKNEIFFEQNQIFFRTKKWGTYVRVALHERTYRLTRAVMTAYANVCVARYVLLSENRLFSYSGFTVI